MPPYIKEQGGRSGRPGGGAPGGVLLPPGVGLPPFPCWIRSGGGKRRERQEGKGGGAAPSPCPIQTRGRGARPLPWPPLLFSTKVHYGPLTPRGVPVTPRYSGKIPISPETLPISKYRLPIYQSSCLDHFETPRHVRDHICDSEQPSVHQTYKLII